MCGINLLVAGAGRADLVHGMNAAIGHRGPDGSGVWTVGPFSLGNVRLAIRDVAHGQQPMTDNAAGLAVSFNGEVWNYPELRAELEALGHVFRTDCDTEVILHGYKEWGEGLFARLHADFGLAIVDARARRALIARDRMGIKPLYYTAQGAVAAASSEIKALLRVCPAGPGQHRPIEPAFHDGLFERGNETEVDGICTVLPGEVVEFHWQNGRPLVRRDFYARWDYTVRTTDEDEAVADLAELLEESIRRQVVSARPVAVALSGGIDSSIVAAIASKYVDLMCYSIGAADVTETENARAVADYLAARGHRILGFREVRIDEDGVRRHLDAGVWHLESSYPIQADMSIVSCILARQVSRDGYKVFLSGEGADELFLGYHSYFRRRQREGKLHEAMIEQVENLHRYNNARLDKACMAHGVESRVPFQYGPLVEYAIAIDPELKMGNPTPANGLPDMQKYVLRRAVERLKGPVDGPLLPADVVWRRKEYYAKGMALPDLIAQALALPCQGMSDAEAARVRHQVYADRFLRLLLSPPAARGLTDAA